MSYAPKSALVKRKYFAKSLNYKYRIILFDGDKHDRALLGLALRSALPNAEVLDVSSAVEVAHHISAGPWTRSSLIPLRALAKSFPSRWIFAKGIQPACAGYSAEKDPCRRYAIVSDAASTGALPKRVLGA